MRIRCAVLEKNKEMHNYFSLFVSIKYEIYYHYLGFKVSIVLPVDAKIIMKPIHYGTIPDWQLYHDLSVCTWRKFTVKWIIALKEINSQTGYYLVSLSSKTYVFEDKLTKY